MIQCSSEQATVFVRDPSLDQPTHTRTYECNDPLMFPELLPPKGKTHFHGRWVHIRGNTRATWVEYPPATISRMMNIPPNTPSSDAHWKGRTMPGGTRAFASGAQAMDFIKKYRDSHNIPYDPSRPGGPSFRVEHPENQRIAVPPVEEYQRRTPIRYAPVQHPAFHAPNSTPRTTTVPPPSHKTESHPPFGTVRFKDIDGAHGDMSRMFPSPIERRSPFSVPAVGPRFVPPTDPTLPSPPELGHLPYIQVILFLVITTVMDTHLRIPTAIQDTAHNVVRLHLPTTTDIRPMVPPDSLQTLILVTYPDLFH